MAKLCPECKDKPLDTSVAGRCGTPATHVPTGHLPWTEGMSLTMCDACCDKFDRCARCNGPLSGGGGIVVPTEKQFVRVNEKENGRHVTGMYIGEQILFEAYVDVYSGMTWRTQSLSPGVRLYGRREVAVPGNWRMVKLELYFDLTEADPKAYIDLVLAANSRWASGTGGSFRCTMEVEH
jgi:hypothetical protein